MTIFYSAAQRGFYDSRIHKSLFSDDEEPLGIIADAVQITAEEHSRLLAGNSAGKEITAASNGYPTLTDPDPSKEELWTSARMERDARLDESDYTQMPDYELSNKGEWADYRQQLRDITEVFSTPDSVIWPEKPGKGK
jgi:hypothetical protein